jgi:hypothetical protein
VSIEPASGDPRVVSLRGFTFILNLAVVLHRRAMYPADHQAVAPALAALAREGVGLLQDRASIAIGLAGGGLVLDGVPLETRHGLVRALAQRLRRHEVGGMMLMAGVEPWEITELADALAEDAEVEDARLGRSPTRTAEWPHVRVLPIPFSELHLVDSGDAREQGNRTRVLWLQLASAALAQAAGGPDDPAQSDPTDLARAVESRSPTRLSHRALFHALRRIAEALSEADGGDAALRDQTSEFLSALDSDAIAAILDTGTAEERRHLAARAVGSLAPVAAVKVLVAAAPTLGRPFPPGLARMLSKMADHAQRANDRTRAVAEAAVREHAATVIEGWETPAGAAAPRGASGASSGTTPSGLANRQVEAIRLVSTSLEVGVASDLLASAVHQLAAAREIGTLLDLLARAAPSAATALAWRTLITPQTVQGLLASRPLDLRNLDRLLPHLRGQALEPVFDCVATSENRAIRRALLDRLVRRGPEIATSAVRRLDDHRWYVVRNMLMVLAELGEIPRGPQLRRLLAHEDARVRLEALRVAMGDPEQRQHAITEVLSAERDPRVIWFALSSLRRECPAWAVDLVIRLVRDPSVSPELRAVAVRVLGHSHEPVALDMLLELSERGAATGNAADRTAAEALRGLASTWPHEMRARRALEQASGWLRPRSRARIHTFARRG